MVGKFVEFFGDGAASLPIPDRATIGNMSPEYGATCGFFPVDDVSCEYLRITGRAEACRAGQGLLSGAGHVRHAEEGELDYSEIIELDLATVKPAVSGPRRPHDRLDLPALKSKLRS